MRGPFAVAVGMFTVLPAPVVEQVDRRLAGRVLVRLPLVGILVGALAGGGLWLTALTGSPWLPPVVAVAILAWVTGGLHLDGLADTADGLGSRRAAPDALAVMKRSDIGPMGVITLILVLLADVAALASVGRPAVAAAMLVTAAMFARLAVVHASPLPSARPGGFGDLFSGSVGGPGRVLATSVSLVVAAGLGALVDGWQFALLLVAAGVAGLAVAWGWARHLVRRLGGMTGDTFGSIAEVAQLVNLALVSLALAAIPGW